MPAGPPFDLETISDLHAGLYPDQMAVILRGRIAADPDAFRMLAALKATVTDLEQLSPLQMPSDVAARLDAALAAEATNRERAAAPEPPRAAGPLPSGPLPSGPLPSGPLPSAPLPSGPLPSAPQAIGPQAIGPQAIGPQAIGPQAIGPHTARPQHFASVQSNRSTGPGNVVSLDAARSRRRSRWATGLGMAAAVAAVATVVIVAVRPFGTTGGAGLAVGPADVIAPTSAAATTAAQATPTGDGIGAPQLANALVVVPGHLDRAFDSIKGVVEAGKFADPDLLAQCLAANDEAGKPVLGVRQVTYMGEGAYAISVGLDSSTAEILVVGGGCGQHGAQLLDQQLAPR